MKVLVINCGSSSVKWQVVESTSGARLAEGKAERIGEGGRDDARIGMAFIGHEVRSQNIRREIRSQRLHLRAIDRLHGQAHRLFARRLGFQQAYLLRAVRDHQATFHVDAQIAAYLPFQVSPVLHSEAAQLCGLFTFPTDAVFAFQKTAFYLKVQRSRILTGGPMSGTGLLA